MNVTVNQIAEKERRMIQGANRLYERYHQAVFNDEPINGGDVVELLSEVIKHIGETPTVCIDHTGGLVKYVHHNVHGLTVHCIDRNPPDLPEEDPEHRIHDELVERFDKVAKRMLYQD